MKSSNDVEPLRVDHAFLRQLDHDQPFVLRAQFPDGPVVRFRRIQDKSDDLIFPEPGKFRRLGQALGDFDQPLAAAAFGMQDPPTFLGNVFRESRENRRIHTYLLEVRQHRRPPRPFQLPLRILRRQPRRHGVGFCAGVEL